MISTYAPRPHRRLLALALLATLLVLPRPARGVALTLAARRPHTAQWSNTGPALEPLAYGTATLLPSGQVLLAGGTNGTAYYPTGNAELYTPATGTFAYTPPMVTARQLHTATLLRDGRVLLAGGESGSVLHPHTAVTNAELYDPGTNSFTATGALGTPRDEDMAAPLYNGQVLVAGGCNGTFNGCTSPWNSAELYTPATGTFTATGAMGIARMGGTATPLDNGQVLVVGGAPCNACQGLPSAELYTPATGTFTPTRGPLHVGRALHTATLLPDGRVLIAGGCHSYHEDCYYHTAALTSTEVYNPRTQAFSYSGALQVSRYNHTATLLRSGLVLIAGGANGSGGPFDPTPLASAELYNPATGRSTGTAALLTAQESALATRLPSGQVLLVGGCLDGSGSCLSVPLTTAELYTP